MKNFIIVLLSLGLFSGCAKNEPTLPKSYEPALPQSYENISFEQLMNILKLNILFTMKISPHKHFILIFL